MRADTVDDVTKIFDGAKKRGDVKPLEEVGVNPDDIKRSPLLIANQIRYAIDQAYRATGVDLTKAKVMNLNYRTASNGGAAAAITNTKGQVTFGGRALATQTGENLKKIVTHEAAHAANLTNSAGQPGLPEEVHEALADKVADGGAYTKEKELTRAYLEGDNLKIHQAYIEAEQARRAA